MIVLDTNVVSEAMKPDAHPAVRAWLNDQAAETLYLSSVTLAELLFGIAALPAGQRRDMLGKALDGLLSLFRDRARDKRRDKGPGSIYPAHHHSNHNLNSLCPSPAAAPPLITRGLPRGLASRRSPSTRATRA